MKQLASFIRRILQWPAMLDRDVLSLAGTIILNNVAI